MAVQAMTGVDGAFSMTGHVINVQSWASDQTQDIFDVTPLGASGNWRVRATGAKSVSGTFSGYLFSGLGDPKLDFTASNDQTGVSGTLTMKSGYTIAGTFLLSRMTVAVDMNGASLINGTFASTGPVTISWTS